MRPKRVPSEVEVIRREAYRLFDQAARLARLEKIGPVNSYSIDLLANYCDGLARRIERHRDLLAVRERIGKDEDS